MDIIEQLKRDEGFRSKPYEDTKGKLTVGYGHNLKAHPIEWITPDTVITPEEAEDILHTDASNVLEEMNEKLSWSQNLDDARHGVLWNMGFNMGVPDLLTFKHTLLNVNYGNYEAAASSMEKSEWYGEVGERAVRLCAQMRTGQWV